MPGYNSGMLNSNLFTIRPFEPRDARALAEIQITSYRTAYVNLLPDEFLSAFSLAEQEQDWLGWLPAHPQDLLLVAESVPAGVVGYALVRPQGDWPGYAGELLALHIRQGWQRLGIGRALAAEAARRLRDLGCPSMMVWVLSGNLQGCRFYEHLGAQRLGEHSFQVGDEENPFNAAETAYGWPQIQLLAG